MKLDVDVNAVVLSNVGTTGEFKIRNSAKAFKILSDGLYSNKIRAIIRELGCNAVDSHVAAKKEDVPFEVHLPSIFEPWFSVRDYGIGLNGDQVVNIYTTYFESTKTGSNDFIGALGLGSKSPFSYTENFTVIAIKDGVKRIYSAFINEAGVPCVAEMSVEDTTDINGVEVKFSVTNRNDYYTFMNESRIVFRYFKNKPKVIGVNNFVHDTPKYHEQNIVPGIHTSENPESGGYYGTPSTALMGNISYPISLPDPEKHFGSLAELLSCGLVIEFDIGDLDFAASREALSYVPLTIASIKRKLEYLNANLTAYIEKHVKDISHDWAKSQYLKEKFNTRLFSAAVKDYVTKTKFDLIDITSRHSQKEIKLYVDELEKLSVQVTGMNVSPGSCYNIKTSNEFIQSPRGYRSCFSIPIDMSVVIVLNDLNTGCTARAKYHYQNHNNEGRKMVFCLTASGKDLAERQKTYDLILKKLRNPPTVVKASTLIAPERKKAVSNSGITFMELKVDADPSYAESYKFTPYNETIDDNETYYYVCLSNQTPIDLQGKDFDIRGIKSRMARCGVKNIEDIKIFGVRKNRINEIKELDNWIWVEDKLKEEIAKVSESHIASLIANGLLDQYSDKMYTNTNLAKLVDVSSFYSSCITEFAAIKRSTGNVHSLVELCRQYGNLMHVDAVTNKINAKKKALRDKYPLLVHLNSADNHLIAEYIKLIDRQQEKK